MKETMPIEKEKLRHIKSIDDKAWRAILKSWHNKVVTWKPEKTWSTEEDHPANSNFKALNVIFAVINVT